MNRTILLVGEKLEVLAKVSAFLEDLGHLVQTADSRKEALSKIRAFDPGLIIASFKMTDGNGFELIEELRTYYQSKAPVVLMAPLNRLDQLGRRPEAKAVQAWIKWPIEQMELYNVIGEWLGREVEVKTAPVRQANLPDESVRPRPRSKTPILEALKKPGRTHTGPAPVSAPPPSPVKPAAVFVPLRPQTAKPKRLADEERQGEIIGNLARTPIAHLLFQLGQREETGLLTMNYSPNKMKVHFEGGFIVQVESNYIPDLSLGVILAKRGDITPGELAGARKRWERDGGLLGQTLLALQLVNEPTLERALLEQRLKKVLSLFTWQWERGTYIFTRGADKIEPQAGFRLRVEPAIIEGIHTCYDLERLNGAFNKNQRLNLPLTLAKISAEELLGRMDHSELQQVINALRTSRTLGQAMSVTALDELTFLQYTYALYVLDLLRFREY